MTDFKRDMTSIQQLVSNAFGGTGSLTALADGAVMSPVKLQQTLEKTLGDFEAATLQLRTLCEQHSPGVGGYGVRPTIPPLPVIGVVEPLGYNWLHIRLNTLLPHCRYQSPAWLTDTIRRLLADFESRGNHLPYFLNHAHMVIDEHSNIDGRNVFDQDNKGWKAVCNAIKGRLIPDDDQYTLGLSLLSTRSPENVCHITIMDRQDVSDFFAFHSGDYASGSVYEREYP